MPKMLLEAGCPLTMSVRESIQILRSLRKSLRNMRKPAAPSPRLRLNDALRSFAERFAAQELPALASAVTERHLTLPAFLVARWQTTYPTRIPVLEPHWQRQAAK